MDPKFADSNDTIVAPASGAGRAAIAVIRIAGPRARAVLEAICGVVPEPRHASLRDIGPPRRLKLDRGLVLWFPGPASFTGEDMAELHVHGSRAVIREVIEAVLTLPATRLAEPGEFARRAFENGKLDLTEVEGLADLISAETEAHRRQALAQAEGSLRALYEGWRRELLQAQALVEAGLDFADEGDVVADVSLKADAIVASLRAAIARQLADRSGERLREGLRVVIAGPPNVGKSSLLNALAKRDAAIVSEEAGTTRDVIEVHLDLAGLPVILTDTAGIRETAARIEQEGIRRTLRTAEQADLNIWLMDAHEPHAALPDELRDYADRTLSVLNKVDLLPGGSPPTLPDDMIAISATTGEGLTNLTRRLAAIAAERIGSHDDWAIPQVRHRRLIEAPAESLEAFLGGDARQIELRAEDLRRAADALGRITGRVDVEDVLDHVFKRFCIGK